MKKFTYARLIGRNASCNTVTVQAQTEQEAFEQAAKLLGTRNIRLVA